MKTTLSKHSEFREVIAVSFPPLKAIVAVHFFQDFFISSICMVLEMKMVSSSTPSYLRNAENFIGKVEGFPVVTVGGNVCPATNPT